MVGKGFSGVCNFKVSSVWPGRTRAISLEVGWQGSPIFVFEWFLAFTAFVGLDLVQGGFTGFCPPEKLLAKMGFKRGNGGSCCG